MFSEQTAIPVTSRLIFFYSPYQFPPEVISVSGMTLPQSGLSHPLFQPPKRLLVHALVFRLASSRRRRSLRARWPAFYLECVNLHPHRERIRPTTDILVLGHLLSLGVFTVTPPTAQGAKLTRQRRVRLVASAQDMAS